VAYAAVTDQAALDAFLLAGRAEGVLPALETAHAVAHAVELAAEMPRDTNLVMNMSGRGDKDVEEALRLFGGEVPEPPKRGPKRKGKRRSKKPQGDGDEGGDDSSPADGRTDDGDDGD
jgi:threonine synthase